MAIDYVWRGPATNDELNALHAEAFETRVFNASEWDWDAQLAGHSLGWVVAREAGELIGFVNVPWDGLVHAWIQDTMVARTHQRRGIAMRLVENEERLRPLYIDACGFVPTAAGVMALR